MDSITRYYSTRRGAEMGLLNKSLQCPSRDHPNMSGLRIVLLGKNISENSRVRNAILGIDVFESETSSAYLQQHSVRISGMVENRHVTVINTPHLLQPNLSLHQITQIVRECVSLSAPGPHVLILVLQYHTFSEEDRNIVEHVLKQFSEQAIKRTIVITTDTHSIQRSPVRINEFINELLRACGGGHLQFDDRKPAWRSEVFRRVEKILSVESEEFLICDMYEDAEEETSVDEKKSISGSSVRAEEDSDHEEDGKLKESQKIRDDGGCVPSHSSSVFGKAKLNLVLCGRDNILKVSMSKIVRGTMKKALHQKQSSSVCVKKEEKIHGRQITVVELPALTQLSEEEVMRETLRCVSLCDPGVNVFLLIIPFGPLTVEDKTEIEKIQKIFYSREHFMVLFVTDHTVDKIATDLKSWTDECQRITSLCGGHYKMVVLKEHGKCKQIPELLDYIENLKTEPYSLQMYMKAHENRVRHELQEEHKEELKRMKKQIKVLQQKIQLESAESEADDLKHLRIVLIGRTGNGKSATGNTILGRNEFQSKLRSDSVTTVCKKGVGEVEGRSVAVVDTPGLFDTTLPNEQVVEEIMKCVSLSAPGPHVFIIVLSLGRFIQVESDTVDLIKKIFGHKAAQFSIVLFTRGDELDESIEDYVSESKSAELKKLIRDCGNRFLLFNNKTTQDCTQVNHLLNMIEDVKRSNRGQYFTNSMFEEAEMSIKKRMEEILKEKEKEIQAQNEQLKAKYEMEKEDIMKRLEEEKRRSDEERMKMEYQFREKEQTLRKEFEEREKAEQKKQEIENQKRSEYEKQQRADYHLKIDEMKREIENQRSQYKKQQIEREEEDRKREEKYKQDQEKMKNEQDCIIAELQLRQEEEIKKRQLNEQRRIKEEEEERKKWKKKIKEAENDKKEIQEEIKQQQRAWEDEKRKEMAEREEEERKRKVEHEEQLREKQNELENMRKKFEREREEERHKKEQDRQKLINEREQKEKEYEEKKNDMNKHYEQLERERRQEWEKRKQEEDKQREEERKRWEKMIKDITQEREAEISRKETEEKERKEREFKERAEMKQKHEEEMERMKRNHVEEARRNAEEFNEFKESKEQQIQELYQMLDERKKQKELLENVFQLLKNEKSEEVKKLKKQLEDLQNKTKCVIL